MSPMLPTKLHFPSPSAWVINATPYGTMTAAVVLMLAGLMLTLAGVTAKITLAVAWGR